MNTLLSRIAKMIADHNELHDQLTALLAANGDNIEAPACLELAKKKITLRVQISDLTDDWMTREELQKLGTLRW